MRFIANYVSLPGQRTVMLVALFLAACVSQNPPRPPSANAPSTMSISQTQTMPSSPASAKPAPNGITPSKLPATADGAPTTQPASATMGVASNAPALFEPLVTCKSFDNFDAVEKTLIQRVGKVPDKMGQRSYNLEKAGLTAFGKPVRKADFYGALGSDYSAVGIVVEAKKAEMQKIVKKLGKGDFQLKATKNGQTEIMCMIGSF